MPLLGHPTVEYQVMMVDDFENVIFDYVLAKDVEHAAWEALKLSSRRNLTLKDVCLSYE